MKRQHCTGYSCIGEMDQDLAVSFVRTSGFEPESGPWSEVDDLSYELEGTPVFRSELVNDFGLDQTDAVIAAAIENAENYDDC